MKNKKTLTFTSSDYGIKAEELIDCLREEKLTLRVVIDRGGILVGENYEEEDIDEREVLVGENSREEDTEWYKKTTFEQCDVDVELLFDPYQVEISDYFADAYASRDPFEISACIASALYDCDNRIVVPRRYEKSELLENSKFGENISNISELEKYLHELVEYYSQEWSEPPIEDYELLTSLQENSLLDLLLNEKELELVSASDGDYTVVLPDLKKNFENWNSGDLIRVKNLFERAMSVYSQIKEALLKILDEVGEKEMPLESSYLMDYYYGDEYGRIGSSEYALGLAIERALRGTKDEDKLSLETESDYGHICRYVRCNSNCDEMNEIMRKHNLPFHFLQST